MTLKNPCIILFLFIFSIILLLWMAIHNGFPLIYADSGAYIWSSITHEVPIDRPVLFGLLIEYFSPIPNLWLVLIVQCCLGYYLIWLSVYLFITKGNTFLVTFLLIVFLVFFTSIAYYAGQILPDFFCSLSLLSFALIISVGNLNIHKTILVIIFILISGTHISNLLSLILVFVALSMTHGFSYILKRKSIFNSSQAITALLLIVCSWLFVCSVNFIHKGGFTPSRSSHIFMMARLNETGVLKLYLDDNCEKEPNVLCSRKNTLPQYGWQFLWTDTILANGPCMKEGWGFCWLEKKEEFQKIIRTVFSTPRYFIPYFYASFKDFRKQLFDIENADLNAEKGPIVDAIIKRYPANIDGYRNSLQYKSLFKQSEFDSLAVPFTNICSVLIIILVVSASLFYASFSRKSLIDPGLFRFSLMIVLAFFANAWVCVFFSTELNRYQGRIAWLMPMLVFIWIGNRYFKKSAP